VADAANAMLAGQVDLIFGNQNVTVPQVEAGRFKALAVTSAARARNLPNVPTMKEAGIDDFVVTSFFGIVAPAGTDPAIVGRLNAAINEALKTPEINASIIKLGSEPSIMSPQDFAALIANDFRRWTTVAKAPGMKIE
jgi:tripartite-type tricarboxylate transporter receptor subunit TctC